MKRKALVILMIVLLFAVVEQKPARSQNSAGSYDPRAVGGQAPTKTSGISIGIGFGGRRKEERLLVITSSPKWSGSITFDVESKCKEAYSLRTEVEEGVPSWIKSTGSTSITNGKNEITVNVNATGLDYPKVYQAKLRMTCLNCAAKPGCDPEKKMRVLWDHRGEKPKRVELSAKKVAGSQELEMPILLKVVDRNKKDDPEEPFEDREILVALKSDRSEKIVKNTVKALEKAYKLKLEEAIKLDSLSLYLVRFRIRDKKLTVANAIVNVLTDFSVKKFVQYAQPNYKYTIYPSGYGDECRGVLVDWQEKINLKPDQDQLTGKEILIAVIDTGVVAHEKLEPHITGRFDCLKRGGKRGDRVCSEIANVKNIKAEDHAPMVIGILSRVATESKIISLRVASEESNAKNCDAKKKGGRKNDDGKGRAKSQVDSFALTAALRKAIDEKVNIINLSLGKVAKWNGSGEKVAVQGNSGKKNSDNDITINDLVETAVQKHSITVVAAAGNDEKGKQYQAFPAVLRDVIAVGAIDCKGQLISMASYVDIAAPGTGIPTTCPCVSGDCLAARGTSTSWATPIVTGVAALILQRCPGLPPREIRSLLQETATDKKGQSNIGVVNAHEVVRQAPEHFRRWAATAQTNAANRPVPK